MAWNYTTLKADLLLMMDRDPDSDEAFVAALPSIFEDAERRIVRECPISIFHAEDSGVFIQGTPTIARPSDLIATEFIRYSVNGVWTNLRLRPAAWINEFWPNPGLQNKPRYVSLQDSGAYRMVPTPDGAYPYVIGYRRHNTFLGDANATNVLSAQYPDLLRAALYARAALFSRDDRPENAEERQKHEQNYAQVRAAVFGNEQLAMGTSFEQGSVERRSAA